MLGPILTTYAANVIPGELLEALQLLILTLDFQALKLKPFDVTPTLLNPLRPETPFPTYLRGEAKIAKLAKEKTALKADLLKNHGDRKIQDLTVETDSVGLTEDRSSPVWTDSVGLTEDRSSPVWSLLIGAASHIAPVGKSTKRANAAFNFDITQGACDSLETSDLDANTGISYRHLSLYEVNKMIEAGEPAALFTDTETETETDTNKGLTEELHKRATIPPNVMATIDALPIETHPMTQLSVGMLALQKDHGLRKGQGCAWNFELPTIDWTTEAHELWCEDSKFAQKYNDGMKKDEYWQYALEDALDLIAKIPIVAAKIYRRTFKEEAGLYQGVLVYREAMARCTELFGDGVVTSGAGSCDRPGNAADTPTN
ncbi:Citrate synthase, mitochondrial [Symbiodinium microadriaticum]|uniref:Citrate synthase, mitochondrial n=1 Tax=Symbiodinium microadriaticum TaxID=2951 RepID=A0A1Q9EG28_SYMMI|nr:Citrate synthase, mitochondrial [Symbiodinium microadriaticum]